MDATTDGLNPFTHTTSTLAAHTNAISGGAQSNAPDIGTAPLDDPGNRVVNDRDRAAIEVMLKGFDSAQAAVEEQMKPLLRVIDIIAEGRETLLEHYGVQTAGRCEHMGCGRLLFVGERGGRIRGDDSEVLYCAEHAPTYADFKEFWDRIVATDDTDDEREARRHCSDLIAAHLADGGSLEDKRLEVLE